LPVKVITREARILKLEAERRFQTVEFSRQLEISVMSYMALPKEVPKIEVKQVEKVVEAGLRFWFTKTTYHLVLLCTSQVPNIEYQDRLVEVREAPSTRDMLQFHLQLCILQAPQVREVVRRVPRIEVREIPIERVIQAWQMLRVDDA